MTQIKSLEERNVIIIGGGTAGFATGIYASRAMLEPLLITGDALGGQLSLTLDLENYPGIRLVFHGNDLGEPLTGMMGPASAMEGGVVGNVKRCPQVDIIGIRGEVENKYRDLPYGVGMGGQAVVGEIPQQLDIGVEIHLM